METKDFYKFINKYKTVKAIGISKWVKTFDLENDSKTRQMLFFTFNFIIENKLKIFRWKLMNYILPCKKLLYQWKICSNDNCMTCNEIEDYEHFFLNCKIIKTFWQNIKVLLANLNLGFQVVTFENLVMGYQIADKSYYAINYLNTIILFSIYKSKIISQQKQKNINIFSLFKNEFREHYSLIDTTKTHHANLLILFRKVSNSLNAI